MRPDCQTQTVPAISNCRRSRDKLPDPSRTGKPSGCAQLSLDPLKDARLFCRRGLSNRRIIERFAERLTETALVDMRGDARLQLRRQHAHAGRLNELGRRARRP